MLSNIQSFKTRTDNFSMADSLAQGNNKEKWNIDGCLCYFGKMNYTSRLYAFGMFIRIVLPLPAYHYKVDSLRPCRERKVYTTEVKITQQERQRQRKQRLHDKDNWASLGRTDMRTRHFWGDEDKTLLRWYLHHKAYGTSPGSVYMRTRHFWGGEDETLLRSCLHHKAYGTSPGSVYMRTRHFRGGVYIIKPMGLLWAVFTWGRGTSEVVFTS